MQIFKYTDFSEGKKCQKMVKIVKVDIIFGIAVLNVSICSLKQSEWKETLKSKRPDLNLSEG